jgi:two-component system, chemotaxis family, response regulator Rcp1
MSLPSPPRHVEILLVEDSPADVVITQDALTEARVLNSIHVVDDGEAALAFLRKQPPYAAAPRPDLILLDLNLPRKSGREVLAEIKADPALKNIPVVVLTTSRMEEDIWRAYDLHANCYVVKPLDFPAFVQAVQSIRHFWLSVVTLPPDPENG